MKSKLFFAVIIAIFVATTGAFAQDIKKGDSVKVLSWKWVTVKNPEPVESGNNSFSYNESCGIQRGGILTVVGVQDNRVLVRYTVDGEQYGTPCPSGVVFFTTKEKFSFMKDDADAFKCVKAKEESEKNLVKKLLLGK